MRICKNELTDEIRELFGANPLKIPEARILPMGMLEIEDNKPKYLGQFKFMVKGDFNYDLPVLESPVAQVSNVKTKNIDFSLGVNILGNFIKALGMDPATVNLAIKGTSKMAFSFGNVTRRYIDVLQLGKILVEHEIMGDPANMFISGIMGRRRTKLALITDVLMSTEFSLSTFKENDTEAAIDVPLLQNYLSNLNSRLKVVKAAENEVKFAGDTALTYAFSCVELFMDENGRFSRGQWLNKIRNAAETGKKINENEVPKYIFDENRANPLLIDF